MIEPPLSEAVVECWSLICEKRFVVTVRKVISPETLKDPKRGTFLKYNNLPIMFRKWGNIDLKWKSKYEIFEERKILSIKLRNKGLKK